MTLSLRKYENKGLSGLVNLGNTCYMNSAIQCLSNTLQLTDYFLSDKFLEDYDENNSKHILVKEWKRLLDGIWSSNCTISPNSFHRTIRYMALNNEFNSNFLGFAQNDTQEFLMLMIDTMHEALCKEVIIRISGTVVNETDKLALEAMKVWKTYFKDNYSVIINLFYGQLMSTVEFENTVSSRNYDPCCYFSLSIPNNIENLNIYDCFDLYTSSEILDGDNMIKCEKTNEYKVAKKTIKVWNFPKILIIHLKRFSNNSNKNNKLVSFPINNMDLSKYCVGYDKFSSIYNLYGICNHEGSLNSGHYYAYCRNSNNKWYIYDDNNVREIENSSLISNNAYCLFYHKK